MITLYQSTIFFSLALLAIVIAIFIFATSMYRGALGLSAKEEERGLEGRKEFLGGMKNKLTKKLKIAGVEHLSKELRGELDNLDTELNKIDQSILKSRNRPKMLTVRSLVGIPASFLLMSIIMSGIAIATSGILPNIMWGLSLALVVAGLYFIYRNLTHVELFSGIIDLSTLMEQALDKHAMKTKPIVGLELWGLPLEIQQGETLEVHYDVSLKQGLIGKNPKVRFLATEELDFPEETVELVGYNVQKKNMKNPSFFYHKVGDINPRSHSMNSFKVKAPSQPGEYVMSHWIQCDEYTGIETTFKVRVI